MLKMDVYLFFAVHRIEKEIDFRGWTGRRSPVCKMTCKVNIQKEHEVTLSLVVPCYNEAQALPVFIDAVQKVLSGLRGVQPEIILVNDGSRDETLAIMRDLHVKHPVIRYISFSRNFGKQEAVLVGLQASGEGDYMAGAPLI